jgi:Cu+-exporting ATPase
MDETRKTALKLGGMTSATCANTIEEALTSVEGVTEATVNFALEQATLEYDPTAVA